MPTSTTKANFYADFSSLAALKLDAKTNQQKALRAAAQEFESLFTTMMLKSMRSATSSIGDSLGGSSEMDLYQGMFDQQIATQMSKGKGLGLADMLVQQLNRSGLVKDNAGAEGRGLKAEGQSTEQDPVGRTSVRRSEDVGLKSDLQSSSVSDPQPSALGPQSISSPSDLQPTAFSLQPDSSSPSDFVQSIWPQAQLAAQQLGVDPATLVAHAALETGWGKHVPCNADGSSSFNLFGIKANSTSSGGVAASTVEYSQGAAVKRVERFKTYDSAAACFSDYANLLSNSSRYSGSRNTGSNAGEFAQALQQGGYATDPHYAAKLKAVASSVMSMLGAQPMNASVNSQAAQAARS